MIDDLLEVTKLVLRNGVQHYKDDFGKCFLTCVGCSVERVTQKAVERAENATDETDNNN